MRPAPHRDKQTEVFVAQAEGEVAEKSDPDEGIRLLGAAEPAPPPGRAAEPVVLPRALRRDEQRARERVSHAAKPTRPERRKNEEDTAERDRSQAAGAERVPARGPREDPGAPDPN